MIRKPRVKAQPVTIEKGVLRPKKPSAWEQYPFASMEVGDSFLVKAASAGGEQRRIRNVISSYVHSAQRELGRSFSLALVEGGVRVWRDADEQD